MMGDDGLEGYRGDLNDRCITMLMPSVQKVTGLYERQVAYLSAYRC